MNEPYGDLESELDRLVDGELSDEGRRELLALLAADPLDLGLVYRIVIAVEVFVAALAFLRPRDAAVPLALLFLAFDAALVHQVSRGVTSCGCFGSGLQVSPWVPLVVDSGLLVAVLLARPWRLGPARVHAAFLVPAIVFAIVWWLILFMVLPFGAAPPDEVEPGMATSAPAKPRMAIKLAITTLLAALVTGLIAWLMQSGLIHLRPVT